VPLWQDVGRRRRRCRRLQHLLLHAASYDGLAGGGGHAAHALRWGALPYLGTARATGALIACLVVGAILTPVARGLQMPFAAIGFAAVVSMIPGVFLFRMASGVLQLADGSQTTFELLGATVADGLTAGTIIMAMSFGLIVPKLVIDRLCERSTQPKS